MTKIAAVCHRFGLSRGEERSPLAVRSHTLQPHSLPESIVGHRHSVYELKWGEKNRKEKKKESQLGRAQTTEMINFKDELINYILLSLFFHYAIQLFPDPQTVPHS